MLENFLSFQHWIVIKIDTKIADIIPIIKNANLVDML